VAAELLAAVLVMLAAVEVALLLNPAVQLPLVILGQLLLVQAVQAFLPVVVITVVFHG
jgi:hypothetical protein